MTVELSDMVAAPRTLTIGKDQIVISPLTDNDWAEYEQWMRARELDLGRQAIVGIDDLELKKSIMQDAVQRASKLSLGTLQTAEIMASSIGSLELLWFAVRKRTKGMTKSRLFEIITQTPELLAMALNACVDAQGNTQLNNGGQSHPLSEPIVASP